VAALIVLLTFAETAERLRRTPAALKYMVYKGTAPKSALISGRRMFSEQAVNEYLEAAFAEAS
jgi:hypothetical protein